MRLLEGFVVVALGAFVPSLSCAQAVPGAVKRYQPNSAAQLPPLRVEVIDGTRFRDIETKMVFRLFGVETCSAGQTAMLGRQPWPCDTVATAWLVNATLNKWLACAVLREEETERLARCATADHADLAADMLRAGIAVRSRPAPDDPALPAYALAEQQSRKAYRGLWSSAFDMPWDWRAAHGGQEKTATRGEVVP